MTRPITLFMLESLGGKINSGNSDNLDGDAISSPEELSAIRPLKLIECKALDDSYVQLQYKVIHRQGV